MKTEQCPFHVREDLPPLTDRIAALPVDERGYPIPFFVDYVNGKPDFRVADGRKWKLCVKEKLCWVCGQKLGTHLAFTIGPMCAVNRTTSEPPEHLDCAMWSVKGCPFLSKPQMKRREDEFTDSLVSAGNAIKRNPGATCIWVTKTFLLFGDGKGGALIRIGDPVAVTWWKLGREATRAEVDESIRTGFPLLQEEAAKQPGGLDALNQQLAATQPLLPRR
jgi:hypothetical protein